MTISDVWPSGAIGAACDVETAARLSAEANAIAKNVFMIEPLHAGHTSVAGKQMCASVCPQHKSGGATAVRLHIIFTVTLGPHGRTT
jgi:hypothetical protein